MSNPALEFSITSASHAEQAIEDCRHLPAMKTAVVHPVKAGALSAIAEAAEADLIEPLLIGPLDRIEAAAVQADVNIDAYECINARHSHAAAEIAARFAAEGSVSALMKGSLHTSELLGAVVSERRLRTERRMSHVYVIETPSYRKPFMVTDGGLNIAPTLKDKADIVQNAIDLWRALHGGDAVAKVAALAAVETVNPEMPATMDAACLAKMVDRGQITGGMIDGPLAFDNAISKKAALDKGIRSQVAGDADILLAPDLEAGNILAKQLTFLGGAYAAGIVLGASAPIILPSRADSFHTRLLSCALAVKLHYSRQGGLRR